MGKRGWQLCFSADGSPPGTAPPEDTDSPVPPTDSPVPPTDIPDTTTTPGSDNNGLFGIEGTGCVAIGNCISSLNYPSNYGNGQECTVSVANVRLNVQSPFSIERNWDHLRFDGVNAWTSSEVPASMSGGEFTWRTDGSVTRAGWKICLSELNPHDPPVTVVPTSWPTMGTMPATNVPDTTEAPPATTESPTSWPTVPATTTAGAMFSVSGSGCTTTSSCVSSKNYPSRYGNRQSCTVTMSRSVRLDVQSPFEIERNYDYLRVNGAAKWTSSSIPSTLNVGGTIAWFTGNDGGDVPPPVEGNGPTRTCSDVYSYERSNDWQPWCTVSSGPLSSGTVISFTMSWKDQGWGYQKGRVALVETIAGEEDPLAHFQTDRAPHSRSTYTGSYTLTQDVDNLEFRYRVGGGGGHRIYINDFEYTMTEPEDDGAFSMNMVELDMTEAESLAWKQEKDDKVREMKVQQLKEQIKLEAEIAAREYSMVQEVIFNPLLIEVFAFIGAVSIVGAVVRKGMEYRNKGDYINIEQEI